MNDGYCFECGDEFHLDDTGGYNPPCPCGCGMCRSCCAAEQSEYAEAESEEGMAYDPDDDELGRVPREAPE